MAVQKPVAEAWFKATGRPIIEGYGLSETSPVLTCNRGDITEWTGTIGLPLPSTEISIRDDDDNERAARRAGRDLRARAAGDGRLLAAAGRDREGDDAKTASSAPATSASWTTKAASRIVDRKKDMITVSGFKVFPNEVEDVAMSQGGLLECAGGRRARSAFRRSAQAVRGEETAGLTRGRTARVPAQPARQLQGAEADRIPQRTAEDQCRQDPAPRAARRGDGPPAA